MKLIAEQIKYLRARRRELEGKKLDYIRYCQSRESAGMEGIGLPHFLDFQAEMEMSNTRRELEEIERTLSNAEYITERSTDKIDIGTRFTVDFGDGEEDDKDDTILVEKATTPSPSFIFVSVESDLGKAVLGKRKGDRVSYTVTATGTPISATITEVETMKEKYAHFIKEEPYTDRISKTATRELKRLKEEDMDGYREYHRITPSQERLLLEELEKVPEYSHDPISVSKRGHIHRLLKECEITPIPTGETVQVGSIVEYALQKDDEEPVTYRQEVINRAVSTEIDSEYLERISPIGQVIYGLREKDTFNVRRSHQKGIKGVVLSVENFNEKERVR